MQKKTVATLTFDGWVCPVVIFLQFLKGTYVWVAYVYLDEMHVVNLKAYKYSQLSSWLMSTYVQSHSTFCQLDTALLPAENSFSHFYH